MRHGDAVAEARGAKRLTVAERLEDFGSGMAGDRGNLVGELFENVTLGDDIRANQHGLLGEDVGKFH